MKGNKMEKPEDLMMTLAKSMHDSNRSGANYGKLFLLNLKMTEY